MKYNYVSIFFKQRPLLKFKNRYPVFHIPTRTCVVIDRNCKNLKEWRKLIKQMYWSIINYLLISESFFFNTNKMNSNSDLNIPSPQCGPLNPARQWHSPLIQRPLPLQFGTSHSFSGTLHSWPFHPWLQWHTPPMYCPLPLHTTGQSPKTHDIVITRFTRYHYHTFQTWYHYHTVHIWYRYHTVHTWLSLSHGSHMILLTNDIVITWFTHYISHCHWVFNFFLSVQFRITINCHNQLIKTEMMVLTDNR